MQGSEAEHIHGMLLSWSTWSRAHVAAAFSEHIDLLV